MKGAYDAMERSENVSYMDLLLMEGRLFCTLFCGVVLWKHIQRCDAEGKTYTEIDLNAAAQEAEQLMRRFHSRINSCITQLSEKEANGERDIPATPPSPSFEESKTGGNL